MQETREVRGAWEAWEVRLAREAWEPREVRLAREAEGAWDARGALMVYYVVITGRLAEDKNILTTGLREAYQAGAEIVLLSGPDELGWA